MFSLVTGQIKCSSTFQVEMAFVQETQMPEFPRRIMTWALFIRHGMTGEPIPINCTQRPWSRWEGHEARQMAVET